MISRVLFKSESVEWATPETVYQKLDAEFHFNFDPCPLGGSACGLSPLFSTWTSKRVFCNPPYGDVAKWLELGRGAEIAVFLLPARTDTRWFHEQVIPFAQEIRFIKGRLKFGGAEHNAPFPSMVVVIVANPFP